MFRTVLGAAIAAIIGLAPLEAAAKTTTVSFLVFGDPAEKEAYELLVADFEKNHPQIKIDLIYTPSQTAYLQRLAVDFAAGTPADVFFLNYRRYAYYASRNQIEPLDAYVAKSSIIDLKDFYPEAVKPFYWKGKLVGIPQNISSLVVYYNKTLFDKSRIPYPKDGWTWDEFVETAKALTLDTDGDGRTDQFGLGTEAQIFRSAPFIWMNGGDLVDNPENPTKLTLDTPASREALQWFVDLQQKHKVVPDRFEEQAEPSINRFLRGTTAMYFNSRRGVPTYRDVTAFDWDVAPLPTGKQPAGILHADAFFMAKACKHKAAAWAFIEYANSVEGQILLAKTGRTVPSRKSVAESPAYLEPGTKPSRMRVFLDVIPHVRAVPIMAPWVNIEVLVGQELEQAYHGMITLDTAIQRATDTTREFFVKK